MPVLTLKTATRFEPTTGMISVGTQSITNDLAAPLTWTDGTVIPPGQTAEVEIMVPEVVQQRQLQFEDESGNSVVMDDVPEDQFEAVLAHIATLPDTSPWLFNDDLTPADVQAPSSTDA